MVVKSLLVLSGLLALAVSVLAAGGESDNNWTNPAAITVKQMSAATGAQHDGVLFNNIDCTLLTYRMVSSGTMQSGCFTDTAFGLYESDGRTVIFNGTDEGLGLRSAGPNQILAPWPGAVNLIALQTISTGGAYLDMYRDPLAHLDDVRDVFGRLVAKQLASPADLQLTAANGKRIIINPATLAFSDGGSWLAAETMQGSFVRINLATLAVTPFAPPEQVDGIAGSQNSKVAVSDDGKTIAIANDNSNTLKVYDVAACIPSGKQDLTPWACPSKDYQPTVRQHLPTLRHIQHLRFANQHLLSFEAYSAKETEGGTFLLAPRATIGPLTDYLAVGDSFSSGEGTFDYRAGTDSDKNHCHSSRLAWPALIANDLFNDTAGHSVACSGARIRDVGDQSPAYRGQVDDVPPISQLERSQPLLLASIFTNYLPGYIAQHNFMARYQPAVTTVSVGGNDVGFGDIIERCVTPRFSLHHSDNICFGTYEDRKDILSHIDRTIPRWKTLFTTLKAQSPLSRLYVVGYPQIVTETGSCALNVRLDKSELLFAQELTDYLNASIAEAAESAQVDYVDISDALKGHRLCEATAAAIAVNGATAGKDSKLFDVVPAFGKESYHPNRLGHQLMAQAILAKTANLSRTKYPLVTSPKTSDKLLSVPKSGRKLTSRTPESVTKRVVSSRKQLPIKTDGKQAGVHGNKPYTVRLDGPAGIVIGNGVTDADGSIETTVDIPPEVEAGGHSLDIIVEGQTDTPLDITQPIYIPISDTDADGDGVPDGQDSCPLLPDSGADQDHDGVDDTCDSDTTQTAIPTPLVTPPTANTSLQATEKPFTALQTAAQVTIMDLGIGVIEVAASPIARSLPSAYSTVAATTPLQSSTQRPLHAFQRASKREQIGINRQALTRFDPRFYVVIPVLVWILLIIFTVIAKWYWAHARAKASA